MEPLKKTITTQVRIDSRIADLVYFVKSLVGTDGAQLVRMSDDELIAAAESFWDDQHGEE